MKTFLVGGKEFSQKLSFFFIPDSFSGSFGSIFLLLPWSMVGIFTGKWEMMVKQLIKREHVEQQEYLSNKNLVELLSSTGDLPLWVFL